MSRVWDPQRVRWSIVLLLAAIATLVPAVLCTHVSAARADSYSWQIVPSPNTTASAGHSVQNELYAVLALSSTNAWAVGSGDWAVMIQHWNGSNWAIFPAPTIPGATQSKLLGIDATSANDIWAVGYYISDNWHPLALHYNGSAWTVVPVPSNLGTYGAPDILALNSVTVIAANDVWVVGGDARSFSVAQSKGGLEQHWNGSSWTPAIPPAGGGFGYSMAAVTSVAGNNVVTVGPTPPWSYQWNGSQWNQEDSTLGNYFTAIDAADAQHVMAVGTYPAGYLSEGGYYPATALTRLYDGTNWLQSGASRQPQRVGTGNEGFNAVTAVSAGEFWAVGYAEGLTMAQRWNGTTWTLVPSANGNPSPSASQALTNVLLGVDALSATDGWAVGYYYDQTQPYGVERTLILRYAATATPPPGQPTIASLSPGSGSTAGGTSVTITGTNFSGVTAVSFGGSPATSYTVNSATTITATTPPHAAGTIRVQVTAAGAVTADTTADDFTYVSPPSDAVVNGGFENGTGPWVAKAKNGHVVFSTARPHSGSCGTLLGGYNSAGDTLYQTITIPASGTLSFWWYLVTQQTGTKSYDYLYVRSYNTSGRLVATLSTRSNTAPKNAWYHDSIGLASYAGQTVRLEFDVVTNSSQATTFYVDDVSVK
jgi:hypothetical protein